MLELMHFVIPIAVGLSSFNPNGRNGNPTEEERKKNRMETLQKNTTRFWRLYQANKEQRKHKDKFMTITFRTLPPTIKECDDELRKFIKRLSRFTKTEIQYQGIRELQLEHDRNGNHYHIIFYGLPFVPHSKLLELWCKRNLYQDESKPSGINIKAIDDGYNEITNYLTSYLLKEIIENDFIHGHRVIIESKGLRKPIKHDFEDVIHLPQVDEIEKAVSFIDRKITYYRMR